jgi:hypothetical protein
VLWVLVRIAVTTILDQSFLTIILGLQPWLVQY